MTFKSTLFDQDYVTARYGDEREMKGRKEGRKEGKKEGKNEINKEIALSLKEAGMSIDFIAKHTGLNEAEIKALGKEKQKS